MKEFSLAPSRAAGERNFSSMAFIHSKLRKCLSPETVQRSRCIHQDEELAVFDKF
jgi:hypothetical protein